MVLGTTSVVAYSIFRDYYLRAVALFDLRAVLRDFVFLAEVFLDLRAVLRAVDLFLAIISSLFGYIGP
jgi:hypothetical protein